MIEAWLGDPAIGPLDIEDVKGAQSAVQVPAAGRDVAPRSGACQGATPPYGVGGAPQSKIHRSLASGSLGSNRHRSGFHDTQAADRLERTADVGLAGFMGHDDHGNDSGCPAFLLVDAGD